MKFKKTKKDEKHKDASSIGGIPFFATVISLIILSISNAASLKYLWDENALMHSKFMLIGFALGAWFSYMFFRNSISVLIHETKHSIVSNLAGNRAKGMKIDKDSGEFTYEYTRSTAKFNALIALAPYFLPCFAFLGMLIAGIFFREQHELMVAIVASGFGADIILNFRDVSPIQTDLTRITGGYKVGVTFVCAINFVILSFLVAWSWHGWAGVLELLILLWENLSLIVFEIIEKRAQT